MTVSPEAYRDAARLYASGVTIVLVAVDEIVHGLTATAFAALSLDPPRVLVCLEKTARTRAYVERAQTFVVNVLAADLEPAARAFARAGEKSFDGLAHHTGETGAPLLDGAVAWFECTVESTIDGGDHDVVIGDVVACGARGGTPLLYFDRTYRPFEGAQT